MTVAEAQTELETRLDHWVALYRSANKLYGPKDPLVTFYGDKCSKVLQALAIIEKAVAA